MWVSGEDGVKHGVGNLIANFIGMAFGYRFRGKQILVLRLTQSEPPSWTVMVKSKQTVKITYLGD
jgi:hypothetical protein